MSNTSRKLIKTRYGYAWEVPGGGWSTPVYKSPIRDQHSVVWNRANKKHYQEALKAARAGKVYYGSSVFNSREVPQWVKDDAEAVNIFF